MAGKFVQMALALVVLLVAILVFTEIDHLTTRVHTLEHACHGQCQHKDKACQDMCFKAGHCPMEDAQ
jgi:hypothetical protein